MFCFICWSILGNRFIIPLNLFYCSRYERKFEQENKLSVNDNRPCFQVSLCVILLLSRELRMRRKWFDFRYHSRWKNNLSQPLTYPMTVVKINRVIAIAYIYFSYASFDMSSLYASFAGCILNVQNAYDKGENVCAINLVSPKKAQLRDATFFKQQRMPLPTFLGYNIIS